VADRGELFGTRSVIPRIPARGVLLRVMGMTQELPSQRVAVRFVGAPPVRRIALATGVTEVRIDGHILRCFVSGSFQPFLEALRGHEVISLESTLTHSSEEGPTR
jgi:hypothetical protein